MGRLGAVGGGDAGAVSRHAQPPEAAIGLADGEDAPRRAVRPIDRAGPRKRRLPRRPAIDPIVRLAERGRGGAVAFDRGLAAAGDEEQQKGESNGAAVPSLGRRTIGSTAGRRGRRRSPEPARSSGATARRAGSPPSARPTAASGGCARPMTAGASPPPTAPSPPMSRSPPTRGSRSRSAATISCCRRGSGSIDRARIRS